MLLLLLSLSLPGCQLLQAGLLLGFLAIRPEQYTRRMVDRFRDDTYVVSTVLLSVQVFKDMLLAMASHPASAASLSFLSLPTSWSLLLYLSSLLRSLDLCDLFSCFLSLSLHAKRI